MILAPGRAMAMLTIQDGLSHHARAVSVGVGDGVTVAAGVYVGVAVGVSVAVGMSVGVGVVVGVVVLVASSDAVHLRLS